MKGFGRWTLLLVLAGCSGSSATPTDGRGGSGGSGGAAGGGAAGGSGAMGGGGAGASGSGGAGGTSGTGGGLAGRGGWGVGGIDPSCVRPDAQLHRFLNLDLRGEAFPGEHTGEWVYVVVKNATSGIVAAGRAIVSGSFTAHFEGGYERNTTQQVTWFADADGDGDCNLSQGDHIGYATIGPFDPAGNDAVSATVFHNDVGGIPGETNPCASVRPFGDMADISLSASGFEAHEGASVYVLTRNAQNGFVFARAASTIASGRFALYIARAYARQTVEEIFWFVDSDGDGVCTSSDHRGFFATPAVATQADLPLAVEITDNHATASDRGADACVVLNGCPVAP